MARASAITVRLLDTELGKALMAEHSALHAYLVGQLTHAEPKDQHRLYEAVIETHDAVARLRAATPPSPAPHDPEWPEDPILDIEPIP